MQFHLLSFEGPDGYARAGGIATRVVPGHNALVMQTASANEFVGLFKRFGADPAANAALRNSARLTAELYAWPAVIQRTLLPQVSLTDR